MSITEIMKGDESGSQMVKFAEEVADNLVKANLTRAQIRTIFSEARQIEAIWGKNQSEGLRKLVMLKPKLAYQAARTSGMDLLKSVLSGAIDEVEKAPEDQRDAYFARFVELFEAILAYHRAKGGRS